MGKVLKPLVKRRRPLVSRSLLIPLFAHSSLPYLGHKDYFAHSHTLTHTHTYTHLHTHTLTCLPTCLALPRVALRLTGHAASPSSASTLPWHKPDAESAPPPCETPQRQSNGQAGNCKMPGRLRETAKSDPGSLARTLPRQMPPMPFGI